MERTLEQDDGAVRMSTVSAPTQGERLADEPTDISPCPSSTHDLGELVDQSRQTENTRAALSCALGGEVAQ